MAPQDGCFVIAEAGINHNGDVELAKDLVRASVEAGADAVKFQTFDTDLLVEPGTETAEYQKRSGNENQYEMLESHELSREDFAELKDLCDHEDIEFISTPYDRHSVGVLESLEVDTIKIASADIINKPLLEDAAATGADLIISTGMATMEEIGQAMGWLGDAGAEDVTVLYCVSEYPTDVGDLDLRFMETLDSVFEVPVGFSDHTLGTVAPVAAATLGARVIEKHITLDSTMEGPDHAASLEPTEFERMVSLIRSAEAATGARMKSMSDEERSNAVRMRRSLHTARDLEAGETLNDETVSILRPAEGLEPRHLETIRGAKVNHAKKAGEPITWADIN